MGHASHNFTLVSILQNFALIEVPKISTCLLLFPSSGSSNTKNLKAVTLDTTAVFPCLLRLLWTPRLTSRRVVVYILGLLWNPRTLASQTSGRLLIRGNGERSGCNAGGKLWEQRSSSQAWLWDKIEESLQEILVGACYHYDLRGSVDHPYLVSRCWSRIFLLQSTELMEVSPARHMLRI